MNRLTLQEILKQIKENWPEADCPETDVMLGVIRLNDIVVEKTRKVVSKFGLTQTAFEVLTTLRAQPEPRKMTPTELYRALLISSGGMTKVLKLLEDDGLIIRRENPHDQRSRFVQLTEVGKQHAETVMDAVSRQDQQILSGTLTKSQIQSLGQTLLQAVSRIENG